MAPAFVARALPAQLTGAAVHTRGFTLIELMVTVAIMGILTAIAYPSYESYLVRTRRAEARSELLRLSVAQERFYTNCNRFAATLEGAQSTCTGLGLASATPSSDNGYYRFSLAAAADAMSYTLTAVPQNGQARDTDCASFTLSDTGAKTASGSAGGAKCW